MHKFRSKFKALPREREALLRGFTLIELLVVIAVIALLVTLSILALSNARVASRDSKRVADIKQIQSALELFYDANNRYPTSAEFQTGSIASSSLLTGTTTYMKIIPTAPTPADGSCTDVTNAYTYVPTADGSSYALNFCTAKKINDIPAGMLAATPGGIVSVAPPAPLAFSAQHLAFVGDGTIFNNPNSVFISGNYAYITNSGNNSLEIVDISNPASPVHKSILYNNDGGTQLLYPSCVYVAGNYAYVIANNVLEIVDVSNPADPKHSGSIAHNPNYLTDPNAAALSNLTSVYVSGNYAYVTGANSNSLEILDISSSTHPIHAGKLISGNDGSDFQYPRSVYVSNNYAYVTSLNSSALEIINVSSSTNPRHAGNIADGTPSPDGTNTANLQQPYSVYVLGNYAYVASLGGSALDIIDISDPEHPTQKGVIYDDSANGGAILYGAGSVKVVDNYAYVVSFNSSALEVVDVTDPANPIHKSNISDGQGGASLLWPDSVFISGNYAYLVSNGSNALEIVDITHPDALTHKGSLANNNAKFNAPHGIYVSGNYAYVASYTGNSLQIVDISNPANPIPRGSIVSSSTPFTIPLSGPFSLSVSGNYAYIASQSSNALEIVNVSNPNNPTQEGYLLKGAGTSTPNLSQPYSVFVSGNYAYVSGGLGTSGTLEVVNISSSTHPVHSGVIKNGGSVSLNAPRGVSVSGNYAYVASFTGNAIEIVDISSSTNPTHVTSIGNGQGGGAGALLNTPNSIFISGIYAYVVGNNNVLEILDITSPAAPKHKGSLANGVGGAVISMPYSVYVSGNYAYITNYQGNSLEIVDVSDPANPKHKALVLNHSNGAKLFAPYSVFVSGNYAYVAVQNSKCLEIISLTGN
jgi:prepilin-type N-terminal cleavage/methylation domain-containing protein